jgi:hypothetical protein
MRLRAHVRAAVLLARARRSGAWRRAGTRGQIGIVFLGFMALALVLAAATMNIGEVARLKTNTANVSDAAALAGASWVASGENELALVARAMWVGIVELQAWLALPFCTICGFRAVAPLLYLVLAIINRWLSRVSEKIMRGAWNMAKYATLVIGLQNVWADDPSASGPIRAEAQRLENAFKAVSPA